MLSTLNIIFKIMCGFLKFFKCHKRSYTYHPIPKWYASTVFNHPIEDDATVEKYANTTINALRKSSDKHQRKLACVLEDCADGKFQCNQPMCGHCRKEFREKYTTETIWQVFQLQKDCRIHHITPINIFLISLVPNTKNRTVSPQQFKVEFLDCLNVIAQQCPKLFLKVIGGIDVSLNSYPDGKEVIQPHFHGILISTLSKDELEKLFKSSVLFSSQKKNKKPVMIEKLKVPFDGAHITELQRIVSYTFPSYFDHKSYYLKTSPNRNPAWNNRTVGLSHDDIRKIERFLRKATFETLIVTYQVEKGFLELLNEFGNAHQPKNVKANRTAKYRRVSP